MSGDYLRRAEPAPIGRHLRNEVCNNADQPRNPEALFHKRKVSIAAVTVVAIGATVGGAYALWSDSSQTATPTFPIGSVAFGAAPSGTALTAYASVPMSETQIGGMSVGGAPVLISVPGSVIAQVLNQTEVDSPPVIWSFAVDGMSPESVGVEFDLAVIGQYYPATDEWGAGGITRAALTTSDIAWNGLGNVDTLLAYSTVQIYPAAVGGDCSGVPALPPEFGSYQNPTEGAPNVYVYDLTDTPVRDSKGNLETQFSALAVISPTGYAEAPSAPSQQTWCVAIQFIDTPDLPYNQQTWVIGSDADNNPYSAYQSWGAMVAFPPSLPMLGYYVNTFTATGNGCSAVAMAEGAAYCTAWSDQVLENGQVLVEPATDSATWWAQLFPDPNDEPDLVIELDPTVFHIDPQYEAPSDIRP